MWDNQGGIRADSRPGRDKRVVNGLSKYDAVSRDIGRDVSRDASGNGRGSCQRKCQRELSEEMPAGDGTGIWSAAHEEE